METSESCVFSESRIVPCLRKHTYPCHGARPCRSLTTCYVIGQDERSSKPCKDALLENSSENFFGLQIP